MKPVQYSLILQKIQYQINFFKKAEIFNLSTDNYPEIFSNKSITMREIGYCFIRETDCYFGLCSIFLGLSSLPK